MMSYEDWLMKTGLDKFQDMDSNLIRSLYEAYKKLSTASFV